MNEINFSIIIPHKNIPELLQRCLDSIPIRDDVQVIVVDDNSNSKIVDFDSFPQWKGDNFTTIFSKQNLLAGGARNEALKYAIGKWLFFVDADDLLTDKANEIFDKYKDFEADSLIFGIESRYCDTLDVVPQEHWYMHKLRNVATPKLAMLELTTSCAKFIKRELVEKHHFQFSIHKHHNDTLFFTKVALASEKCGLFADEVIYVWTYREGSVSHTVSKEELCCHIDTDLEKFRLIKKAGLNHEVSSSVIEHLNGMKSLSLTEQMPIIFKMMKSGMLFNQSNVEPNKNRFILRVLLTTLKVGLKNEINK